MSVKVIAVVVGVPDPGTIEYLGHEYAFAPIHVDDDLASYRQILDQQFASLGADFYTVVLRSPALTTVAHVTSTLDALAARLAPNGLFVVVFCGHGFQAPPNPNAADHGGDGDDPTDDALDEVFAASDGGIADDYFARLWAALPASARVVAIADTCCSDTILQGVLPVHSIEPVINRPGKPPPSRVFISASMTWQEALERSDGDVTHGLLTRALTQAWAADLTYLEWFDAAAGLLASEPQNPRLRYVGPQPSLLDQRALAL